MSRERARKPLGGANGSLIAWVGTLAHMQRLLGKLRFAQRSVSGWFGRVALSAPCINVCRGRWSHARKCGGPLIMAIKLHGRLEMSTPAPETT